MSSSRGQQLADVRTVTMATHRFGILRRFLQGDNLLALGCSEGDMSELLATTGKALTFVEGVAQRCEVLRRQFPKASVIESACEDFQAPQRYDTIVLTRVMEEARDPMSMLQRSRDWLKPNGRLFVAVSNTQSLHRQMAAVIGEIPKQASPAEINDGPRRMFNPESLHGAATEAGLRVDAYGGYSLAPFSEQATPGGTGHARTWTPAELNGFMQLGERYPEIAEEIYVVASVPPTMLATNEPMGNCRMMQLPKISDPRGNLTFIENSRHVPFDLQRIYYLYDVPGGSDRGGHAHKKLQQFVIAVSGSFDVVLDDGYRQQRYHLNRSYQGLYIGPMMWRYLDNFSSGAVCMVLASAPYDESDYYREYDAFIEDVKRSRP